MLSEPFDRVDPEFGSRLIEQMLDEGADFPVVLIDDEIACHSGVDLERTISKAREVAAKASPPAI